MTEKRNRALAVRYDPAKEKAPRLLAKGAGAVAEKILDLARKFDIPVHEDSDLVNTLARLEIHAQIPPELFKAVAEVLAFLYSTNKEFAAKLNSKKM